MRVATDMKPSTILKEGIHQTMAKYHGHHDVPVKQQEILHDFFFKDNQGIFGIPCKDKVCHSSPGMNHVSWPLEKSAFLPKTLQAQFACQVFKKEPPDSNAAVLSTQFSYASHIVQQLKFDKIIRDHFSFYWTSHDLAVYLFFPSLPWQADYCNALVMWKTCHVAKFLQAFSLIPRMLPHVLKDS